MQQNHPNISAGIYDGDFAIDYGCLGQDVCKFKLSEVMPAKPDDSCTFYDRGDCNNHVRRMDAIRALAKKLTDYVKEHEFDDL